MTTDELDMQADAFLGYLAKLGECDWRVVFHRWADTKDFRWPDLVRIRTRVAAHLERAA